MLGRVVTVTTTAAVIFDGTTGSEERPIRLTVKPGSGTVYLGGPDVDASTKGYALASTDEPVEVELVGEHLWAVAGSSIAISLLASGA